MFTEKIYLPFEDFTAMREALQTHGISHIYSLQDGRYCFEITTSKPGMLFFVGATYQILKTKTLLDSYAKI